MILTLDNIKEILISDPNKAQIGFAQEMRKELFMHLYGDGLSEYIKKINSFENDYQYQSRKKYGRSNRDIFERILRPVDKVFSASGGSVFYDLPDRQGAEFKVRLKNTENGLPLRKWIENYWKEAYLADPMGLIFIEIDSNGEAYPTYKGSNEIKAYQLNGRNLDYIIFNADKNQYRQYVVSPEDRSKNTQFFRVVDDEKDIIIKYDGNVTLIEEQTYINYFGHVPAIINSDIPKLGSVNYVSPIFKLIELANEYLRECSVKSVYKLLHGFPKYWEYQSQCPACTGSGNKDGKTCEVCNGTGIKLRSDIADVKHLPIPNSQAGDTVLAPNIAGYIVPPIEAWGRMNEELKDLETLMFTTLWGTEQLKEGENNTATGKFIDTQPINERLAKFADAAEVIETFITDELAGFYYMNSYKGCSVSYGRRFQIESPDTLWEKYRNARTSGAPVNALDDMLREYFMTKFENYSIELQKQLKLMDLEPFVHLTTVQVQSLNITAADKAKKLYFEDFIRTLTDNEIITSNREVLAQKLAEFSQEKADTINNENINNNQNFEQ